MPSVANNCCPFTGVNVEVPMASIPRTRAVASVESLQPAAKSRPIGSPVNNRVDPLAILQSREELAKKAPLDVHQAALKAYIVPKQVPDPFINVYGGSLGGGVQIIEPEYSLYSLIRLPYENSILGQCIEAMVTNIYGMGYGFDYIGPTNKEQSKEAQDEREMLDNFCQYPNDEYTLTEMKSRLGWDYETTGNSYVECGRDAKGQIVMVSHLPSHTIRITTRQPDPVTVTITLPRANGPMRQTIKKTFRRYVQIIGAKRIFFKEFGDPRKIDPETGQENNTLTLEDSATEVLHFSQYNPGSPYGRPRWFNQLPAIMGSRQAELTNLDFFTENAIPAMALLVSGGQVTQTSMDSIEGHFQAARGRSSMHRILVIEAEGDDMSASNNGQVPVPKIEMKPLQSDRQGDALFQNYEHNNREKIRSSFRLTPLFVGIATEMTYASAKAAYEVAETQVFMPERSRFDNAFNMRVLAPLALKYWRVKSLPPKLSDGAEISQALIAFDDAGGLTPNIARALANRYFDVEIAKVTEPWGDFPMPLIMSAFQSNKLSLPKLENQNPNQFQLSGLPEGVMPSGLDSFDATAPTATGAGPAVTPGKRPNAAAQAAGQTKPGKAAKPPAKQPIKVVKKDDADMQE